MGTEFDVEKRSGIMLTTQHAIVNAVTAILLSVVFAAPLSLSMGEIDDSTSPSRADATQRTSKLVDVCPRTTQLPDAILSMPGAQALASVEDCIAGGSGASSCSVEAGAGGATVSCSVSCSSGYACCSATGCYCKGGGDGTIYGLRSFPG